MTYLQYRFVSVGLILLLKALQHLLELSVEARQQTVLNVQNNFLIDPLDYTFKPLYW